MIYAIGRKDIYEEGLARAKIENYPFMKAGKTKTYPGGSVWKTRKEAQTYLDNNDKKNQYNVYGILADWKDTVNSGNHWNDLLIDAEIVKLV